MGIFSKLISTDKITKKIVKYFNTSYDTLLDGLQEILKELYPFKRNPTIIAFFSLSKRFKLTKG